MPGDTIQVRVLCDAGEKSNMTVTAAILDQTVFREGYERLASSVLGLTEFRNTYVEGIIDCNRDGLLYTSIPQNGNWHAYVDGEEVPIILVGDCMIGLALTEGMHTVTFRYRNEAFSLGWKITAISAVILFVLVQVVYKPDWKKLLSGKKRQGKYEKR